MSRASLGWQVLVLATGVIGAPTARGATELSRLPVKEVTIFKDGHAFILHEGVGTVEEGGAVRLDDLPAPVIGTLWPFVSDPQASLQGVAAGRERVLRERTALSVRELLLANIGARAVIHESKDRSYPARIIGIPRRSADELERAAGANGGPAVSQIGEIILLETDAGVRAVGLDTIKDVTFVEPPQAMLESEELRNVLTLRLDWHGAQPSPQVRVGMTYLQKGLRWIPQYRITLGEDGKAVVELQATLINELTDLEDVTTHLVIGVPTFEFEETLDPLALDQTLDRLSIYFRKQQDAGGVVSHFSNAIMVQTQVSRMGEYRGASGAPAEAAGLPLADGEGDLFVFTLQGVTLKQGERMVVGVGRWTVSYEDIYRLRLPFAPPLELQRYFDSQRQADLAKLHSQTKVMHVARLKNSGDAPFTTAPAILMRDGRLLAQGLMTYTSIGSSVDLQITAAVNVPVSLEEDEIERIPDAARWNNSSFQRINVSGRISLSNYQSGPIRIEVERLVLGTADKADHEAEVTHPGWQTRESDWRAYGAWPAWWWSYSWPSWWNRFNTIGRIRWNVEIPAGEQVDLTYTWHYFWQ